MGSRIKGGGRAVLSPESQRLLVDLLMSGAGAEDGGDGPELSEHDAKRLRKKFVKELVLRHERRALRRRFNNGGSAETDGGGDAGGDKAAEGEASHRPPAPSPPAAACGGTHVRVELAEAIFPAEKVAKEKEKKAGKNKKKKGADAPSFRTGAKKVTVLPRNTPVRELLKKAKAKLGLKKNPVRAFVQCNGLCHDLTADLSGIEDGAPIYVTMAPASDPAGEGKKGKTDDADDGGGVPEGAGEGATSDDVDPLEAVKSAYELRETCDLQRRRDRSSKRMGEIVADEGRRSSLQPARSRLPVALHGQRILDAVAENAVVVLSGETGSGKSTQVPQFLLDSGGRDGDPTMRRPYIVITQPRRVAAISLAHRVADERGCPPPGTRGGSVGYIVRSDRRVHLPSCRVIYVTIGILLRMLLNRRPATGANAAEGGEEDVPPLSINSISHLIIDETHERDVNTDFSLTLLRGMLSSPSRGTVPKLILMSATASSDFFVSYFGAGGAVSPVSIEVPGKTHPVECHWLSQCEKFAEQRMAAPICKQGDQSNAGRSNGDAGERGRIGIELSPRAKDQIDGRFIRSLIAKIVKEQRLEGELDDSASASAPPRSTGAILVFLPGLGEIESLARVLAEKGTILASPRCLIMKLHSTTPKADQHRVFEPASAGTVKIVLATNIAETSLTIPDVSHVIDTCRVKESRYNSSSRIKELVTVWTSHASMKQRAGRAGRTSSGTCWRLCSEEFARSELLPHTVPEMARTPLDELILLIGLLFEQRRDEHNKKVQSNGGDGESRPAFALGFKPGKFLSNSPTPPRESSLRQASKHLLEVEALKVVDFGTNADERTWLYRLTPLGFHLSRLPMDAKVGKMLIIGCLLGCLDNALTIAAALSCPKSCFVPESSGSKRLDPSCVEARDSLIENGFGGKDWPGGTAKGDSIAVVAVYRAWSGEQRHRREKYCRAHALNSTTLREMETLRKQFFDMLVDAGLVSRPEGHRDCSTGDEDYNIAREDALLTSCCLVGALYPNVCTLIRPTGSKGGGRLLTSDDATACRPSSSSFQRTRVQRASKSGGDAYAVYHSKHRSIGTVTSDQKRPPETFLTEVNFVSKFALLLFGGELELAKNSIIVDKWLKFRVNSDDDKAKHNAVLILSLRELLDKVILEHVETWASPEDKVRRVQRQKRLIEVVRAVLSDEG